MGSVFVDITMSLDGFVTAPDDRAGHGLGDGGECLHNWVMGGADAIQRRSARWSLGVGLPTSGPTASPEAIGRVAEHRTDAQLHALELLLTQEER